MTKPSADSTSTSTPTTVEPSAFIDDGYTITGVIEARRNLTPEIEITYRPLSWMDREKEARNLDKLKPFSEDRYKARAALIFRQTERWSLKRPLTIEAVMKLNGTLFEILESMIYSSIGPDRLLKASERRELEQVETELKN
jgi:hypothetical protein